MTTTELRSEFQEARRRLREAAPAPKAKGKAGPKHKAGDESDKVLPACFSAIPQAQVKHYLPPGAFLWKSNGAGTWNARMPPMGAHSRSWNKLGEWVALKLAIVAAWHDYCVLEGIPLEQCPMKGVSVLGPH